MPNYEYKCINKDCGIIVTEQRTIEMRDRDKPTCYKCDSETYRLLAAPGLTLNTRGMGWSNKQKGIHEDLKAIAQIEKDMDFGSLRKADKDTKREAAKEIFERKYEKGSKVRPDGCVNGQLLAFLIGVTVGTVILSAFIRTFVLTF